MKHVFRPDSLAPIDVQLEKEHLLHVATFDPESMTEGRVLRAELKNMLLVSRALALLVELLLLQIWDRTFQIVGTRVFMRFPRSDLLGTSQPPVTEILRYLKLFEVWRDARLTLNVPVVDFHQAALDDPKYGEAVANARSTLAELCATRAGDSDTSFNDIFLRWMQRCSRVREFDIVAGTVDGEIVRLALPHRARILGPLLTSLPMLQRENSASRSNEVVATRRMRLVRTTSGNQLLIPSDEHEAPSPGTSIIYARRDRRAIRHWQVLT